MHGINGYDASGVNGDRVSWHGNCEPGVWCNQVGVDRVKRDSACKRSANRVYGHVAGDRIDGGGYMVCECHANGVEDGSGAAGHCVCRRGVNGVNGDVAGDEFVKGNGGGVDGGGVCKCSVNGVGGRDRGGVSGRGARVRCADGVDGSIAWDWVDGGGGGFSSCAIRVGGCMADRDGVGVNGGGASARCAGGVDYRVARDWVHGSGVCEPGIDGDGDGVGGGGARVCCAVGIDDDDVAGDWVDWSGGGFGWLRLQGGVCNGT